MTMRRRMKPEWWQSSTSVEIIVGFAASGKAGSNGSMPHPDAKALKEVKLGNEMREFG